MRSSRGESWGGPALSCRGKAIKSSAGEGSLLPILNGMTWKQQIKVWKYNCILHLKYDQFFKDVIPLHKNRWNLSLFEREIGYKLGFTVYIHSIMKSTYLWQQLLGQKFWQFWPLLVLDFMSPWLKENCGSPLQGDIFVVLFVGTNDEWKPVIIGLNYLIHEKNWIFASRMKSCW